MKEVREVIKEGFVLDWKEEEEEEEERLRKDRKFQCFEEDPIGQNREKTEEIERRRRGREKSRAESCQPWKGNSSS